MPRSAVEFPALDFKNQGPEQPDLIGPVSSGGLDKTTVYTNVLAVSWQFFPTRIIP